MSMMSKKKIFFAKWAGEWLELMKPTVKGNTYAASYANPVEKHITPYFGGKTLDEIRQIDVQAYINLIARKYSKDTVKKHYHCLYRMFETAVENNYCPKNPAARVKFPKMREAAEKRVYTREQAGLVFNYGYRHRFGAAVQFLIQTGVTRSELLALRWDSINFENKTVYIRHGAVIVPSESGGQKVVIGETKNKYRKREIPISSELCGILRGLPRKSEFVFCNARGNVSNPNTWQKSNYKAFMKDMREFYAKQGVDIPIINPHQLRHTRLSLWANDGKNLIAVAKVAGHANLEMLRKRYVHSDVDELRSQLDIN